VPGGIHHFVVLVRDLEASLRFCRYTLRLDVSHDRQIEGDWPALFDAPQPPRVRGLHRRRKSSGRPRGVLELNVFDGDFPAGPPPLPSRTGFFLLSFSSTSRPR
jgi:catechol 2,3-dioxygenase-like lactoylglutathione lyase family enzyme